MAQSLNALHESERDERQATFKAASELRARSILDASRPTGIKVTAPVFTSNDTLGAGGTAQSRFRACVSVNVDGKVMDGGDRSAATKREAEKISAAALLRMLLEIPRCVPASVSVALGTARHKMMLHQLCQAKKWPFPSYDTTKSGPSHAPLFCTVVTVHRKDGTVASGTHAGGTRKGAENAAAAQLMELLGGVSPLAEVVVS